MHFGGTYMIMKQCDLPIPLEIENVQRLPTYIDGVLHPSTTLCVTIQ